MLFPLILVLTGRWRVVFSAAATAILLAALAAFLFGPDVWLAYLQIGPAIGSVSLGGHVDYSGVQTWYSVACYLGAGSGAPPGASYAVTAGKAAPR